MTVFSQTYDLLAEEYGGLSPYNRQETSHIYFSSFPCIVRLSDLRRERGYKMAVSQLKLLLRHFVEKQIKPVASLYGPVFVLCGVQVSVDSTPPSREVSYRIYFARRTANETS